MTTESLNYQVAFKSLPLVAILRGVKPDEVISIAQTLFNEGYRFIEVPLNSPDALVSITKLVDTFGDKAWVGAGTVTSMKQLDDVIETGARLIVTPNTNPAIINKAVNAGCVVMPGAMTVTEAFSAIDAGAEIVKLFPGEMLTPSVVKALRAVLPANIMCIPVGGISADAEQMKGYLSAGANGFGLGSGLYRPGISSEQITLTAKEYVASWQNASEQMNTAN
ncbi:2-dehydro-3-deoxy-6-phosphogalactonate aldolase [Pseudocolwellia agarivorans]|uniref:2-dehydro-3-deoxy-6-phosphogalactonate aldolase n=1 Tax=Pseudocolwellia agarivorans TaxID=1911682 RepID=UPI000986BE5D|nr:2-dehydro-3-deoxy-6-phosphogalactonate aldolase [Pseudocolwellia agarivorans]